MRTVKETLAALVSMTLVCNSNAQGKSTSDPASCLGFLNYF